jgi:hypothetical protein
LKNNNSIYDWLLVIINTYDTKHFSHPKQMLSNNYSQKIPCGMEVAQVVVNPYDYNPFSCPLMNECGV